MAKKVKLPNEVTSKALAVTEPDVLKRDGEATASAKAISAEINAIAKIMSASLYERIAKCAARIVVHAVKHGDVTLATKLTDALGAGWRSNDTKAWFEQFGPFTWGKTNEVDKDGKAIKGFRLNKEKRESLKPRVADDKETAKFLGELVDRPMWVEFKEKEYMGFNLIAQLESLLKKANRVKEKPIAHPKDNIIGLEAVRKALAEAKAADARANAEKMEHVEKVAATA